ncbi:hypothetical protein HU200_022649 [Digitaria exilis]|uniref:MADS-box domain-containing protein n=1 Tax=Digitaria exilis TaxID=1010633 RepID=A0A835EXX7_9POAL|nr:hypothetical protein HU200_022649 [Digitaria exilis]
MARKKVTLQWIANDSTRRATFKKRRKGLMKKASELATLCDVDACVVVYGEGEPQPEVWPDVAKAAQVLARFKAMPELDQCKKMMDMEGFLGQRIEKLREQLHKARRESRERETTVLLMDAIAGRRPGLAGLSVEEITSLGWRVEDRLHGVREAMERFQGTKQDDAPPPATTLQLQLPQVSGLPMVPYAGVGGHRAMQAPPPPPPPQQQQQQGSWMMEVAKAGGGDLGALVYSGFGGGVRGGFAGGAGTSAAAGADMLPQFGNMGAAGFT